MPALKSPILLSTAFDEYQLTDLIGEGGAGRVYGGISGDGSSIAVKLLTQTSSDKRRRFKNEIAFLQRTSHANIVSVIDYGVAVAKNLAGPFYVMRRYDGSLRAQIKEGIPPIEAMALFGQMLDGVEAAHLLNATHRDLKPENFLYDLQTKNIAVADFGVASFRRDELLTLVETGPTQRLANFVYAAPEQRQPHQTVGTTADIYALGLVLNELFTGTVPHGTSYRLIETISETHAYLDPVVEVMIKQDPSARPQTIEAVKQLIRRHQADAVSSQKISDFSRRVIPVGEIDDPIALAAPRLIEADYTASGQLVLTLDHPVNQGWVNGLQQMGNWESVMGAGPEYFRFTGNKAVVSVPEHSAQRVIDYFKEWLPKATNAYRLNLEREASEKAARERRDLQQKLEAEQRLLRVRNSLKI